MKRRDLNPGDVFVYVQKATPLDFEVGTIRYAAGRDPWLQSAIKSPVGGDYVAQVALDTDVVLLNEPENFKQVEKAIAVVTTALESIMEAVSQANQELEELE